METCKAPAKISLPTNQHPVFVQAGYPSCRPTNSVNTLKGKEHVIFCRLKNRNIQNGLLPLQSARCSNGSEPVRRRHHYILLESRPRPAEPVIYERRVHSTCRLRIDFIKIEDGCCAKSSFR